MPEDILKATDIIEKIAKDRKHLKAMMKRKKIQHKEPINLSYWNFKELPRSVRKKIKRQLKNSSIPLYFVYDGYPVKIF